MEDPKLMCFESALKYWLQRAQSIAYGTLSIDPKGKKYIRIICDTGQKSAFCFIQKDNGDVLKTASWSTPAKHARGNIYQLGNEGVERYGAIYLR
jgi:hypothetical protein